MICFGMHSNEMLRFMVQVFQNPPRYVAAPSVQSTGCDSSLSPGLVPYFSLEDKKQTSSWQPPAEPHQAKTGQRKRKSL